MIEMNEVWRLSYGWRYHDPNRSLSLSRLSERPGHIETIPFHSLEAALKHLSLGSWWEITQPDGRVVMSSYKGFDETVCPNPSLCARQILGNYLFPDAFPTDEIGSDLVSHDDGVTWEPVLLGVKNPPLAKNGHHPHKSKPVLVKMISVEPSEEPNRITIHHTSGQTTIRCDRLEIRQTPKGAVTGTYNLVILDPESDNARGVYATLDNDMMILAHLLGVGIAGKQADQAVGVGGVRLVKSWKPGLFKRAQKDGPLIDTRGHVRGSLAIDRRMTDVKGGYAEHTYTYQTQLWHLTHIPTGLLIVRCRKRVRVEEIADELREEIPELTDGDDDVVVDAEMRKRAQAVVDCHEGR